LDFDSSEEKAFKLLERLQSKDELRQLAVNMISTSYKIKKMRNSSKNPSMKELNQLQRYY